MARRLTGMLLGFIAVAFLLSLVVPGVSTQAQAAGVPDISLDKSTDGEVLYGQTSEVGLTASNPVGQPIGFNLSFRDVLPSGISYVPGSASAEVGDPQVINDAPAAGQTTLIWTDVADLTQNSSYSFSFQVSHDTSLYAVGDTYNNEAGAYLNCDFRYIPEFNAQGEPIQTGGNPDCSGTPPEESYTGFATDSASTTIIALRIEKSEPSPEGELLRGAHDNQTVYTLQVENNAVDATSGIQVEDFLPAGLEFLGCGTEDNTTDAPTNPGSTEEYAGSGPINPGNAPGGLGSCVAPTTVETVSDPPGLPSGVYTHVVWSGLGSLPAGGTLDIVYAAAIPLKSNTMTWTGGTPPTNGPQGSNLDNNSGPEVSDEQSLTNHVVAGGDYQGGGGGPGPVTDEDELTRSAEDLRIRKEVSPASLGVGQVSEWSLILDSAEYLYLTDLEITDTLGDGYCPLGPVNFEQTPPPASTECDPQSGVGPSAPYTSVTENANGTWTLVWDSTTDPALAELEPDSSYTLTFPSMTRQNFQENFQDASPVLAHDTLTNNVDISGLGHVICAPGPPSPCPPLNPDRIDSDFVNGTEVGDHSEAEQTGDGPTINKQASPTVNGDCPTLTDYADGANPVARPGDSVCWRLTMTFPADLETGNVRVADSVPSGSTYVPGSTTALATNTVTIATASPPQPDLIDEALFWPLDDGGDVVLPGRVFDVVFATRAERTATQEDGDVTGNLMKAAYRNTDGTSFPIRDQEDFEISQPEIDLLKGVRDVNDQPSGGNGPNVDGVTVQGGDVVTYRVDVTNGGSLDAINAQVWDLLPDEFSCGIVSAVSNEGSCDAEQNRIQWSGLSIPAGETITLTYDVVIPDGLAGGDQLVNTAGIRQFESESGSGPYVQIPDANIDPSQDANANAPAADDPSNVVIEESVLVKTRSTQVDQPGNNPTDQATIGERINYTVTATIPDGTSLYGEDTALVDNVSSRMLVVPGSVGATLDNGGGGGPVPLPAAGLTLTRVGNAIRIDFPDPYANPQGSGDDIVVLTFGALVRDLFPSNFAQGDSTQSTLPNTGTLNWQNPAGEDRSASGSVNTTVVEPQIALDKTADTAGPVSPNDVIEYTIETTNGSGARVSTANDTVVTDRVPVGLTPVNAGVPVSNGGTVNPDGGIWNESTRVITWPTITTIAPGASVNFTYEAEVDDPATGSSVLVNDAEARTTSMPGIAFGRNSGSGAPGYFAEDSVPLSVSSPAILKTGTPGSVTVGQHVTQTIFAAIGALTTDYDVVIEDDLPDGLIFDGYLDAECIIGCPGPVTVNTLGVVANGDGQRIGWWVGDVPAAPVPRVMRLTYSAYVADNYQAPPADPVVDGDSLLNQATLLFNTTDQVTTPPTTPPDPTDFDESLDDDHTTNVVEPDLSLDKTVSGDGDNDDARTTEPGDSYTYSVAVTNNGNSPAFDVSVTDEPDTELTNVEVATDPSWEVVKNWSEADREINWVIPGPIEPGATVTLTYTADLVASSELSDQEQVVNTADLPTYWGIPEAEREDPENAGIEYREYEGNDDIVTLTILIPELDLEKTTGLAGFPDTGLAETQVAFPWRVAITNPNAGSHLLDVDLTDTLPPNWTYVASSAQITGSGTLTPGGQVEPTISEAATGDVLTWPDIADLEGVQNAVVTFEAVPEPEAAIDPGLSDPHVNAAGATGVDTSDADASADGPYADEDDASATLEAPVTDIQIVKTADDPTPVAGTNTTWTLVVRNNGPKVSPDVEVTDVLPAGLVYLNATSEQGSCEEDPAGTMHCEIGRMNVGEEVEIDLTTAVGPDTQGQILVNPADVDDPYIEDSNPTNNHSEDEVTPDGSADVAIQKVVGTPLFAGQTGTYELTVTNNGPSVARDVTVTDTLPENLTYAGAETPVGSCSGSGQDFTCSLGDLDPGQTVLIMISVNVLEGGEYTNCADAASSTPDPVPANNRDCTTDPAANTDLAIEKTGPDYFPVGQTRDFTLLVTNVGDQPSGGTVTVTDDIPDVLEPLAAFGDGWTCGIDGQVVTCTRPDALAPGDSFPLITITLRARQNLLFRPIANTGHVHMPGDPNPDNDFDSVRTAKGAICNGGSLTLKPRFVWVGQKTIVKATLRSEGGAPAVGIPVRVKGNGKGGASGKLRILSTNRRGKVHFTVRSTNTKARWRVSVPQCNLRVRLAPRRQQSCRAMNVKPRSIRSGNRALITARLRSPAERPLIGVTVIAKGQGTGAAAKTNRRGIARLRVRPKRAGLMRVTAPTATRCRLHIGVRDPGAGNTGSQLTG